MFNVATVRVAIVDQIVSHGLGGIYVQLAKRRFADSVTRTSEVKEEMYDGLTCHCVEVLLSARQRTKGVGAEQALGKVIT